MRLPDEIREPRRLLGPEALALAAGAIFACVWLLAAPLVDLALRGLPLRAPESGDVLEAIFGACVWSAMLYFLFLRRWFG